MYLLWCVLIRWHFPWNWFCFHDIKHETLIDINTLFLQQWRLYQDFCGCVNNWLFSLKYWTCCFQISLRLSASGLGFWQTLLLMSFPFLSKGTWILLVHDDILFSPLIDFVLLGHSELQIYVWNPCWLLFTWISPAFNNLIIQFKLREIKKLFITKDY